MRIIVPCGAELFFLFVVVYRKSVRTLSSLLEEPVGQTSAREILVNFNTTQLHGVRPRFVNQKLHWE